MTAAQTRFFCRCGRLLSVDATVREITCPTCRERSVVPHLGAGPPATPVAPPPIAAPREPAGGGAATAILGPRAAQRLGPFEMQSVLGQGGMGSVWRARDTRAGTWVALKVLHPGLQARPDFLSRFQREARAAAGLNHRNIVRVLEAGVDGGTPWIAMELVEGEDLLAAAQRGLLRPDNVIAVALQAAHALLAAAEQGITHRDVKPGNILLTAEGVVKVADFGLAKAVDSQSRVTVTGEILGTPHYMAPEQGRGDRVDHRADFYALGATLYHVLGGAPPHEADSPVAVIMKHLREDPLPLRARNAAVAPGLEKIIHRLLQKEPEQRYQSHAALIDDLERVAGGREPVGGAEPPLRRFQHGATTYMLPHEATTELVLEPAGLLRRGLAFLADLVAVEVLAHVLLVAGRALLGGTAPSRSFFARLLVPDLPRDDAQGATALAIAALAAALLYFVAADTRGGRTVGRQWLSLRLCRRDGSDLGIVRSFARALLLLPIVALLAPALAQCTQHLAESAGLPHAPSPRSLAIAGLGWWLTLELLGRMSAFGRPLHDGLVGAWCYSAKRPRAVIALPPSAPGGPVPEPVRALRRSLVPGGGLIYVGRPILGIATLGVTIALLCGEEPRFGILTWAVTTAMAHRTARQRQTAAAERPPPTIALQPQAPRIRRQES